MKGYKRITNKDREEIAVYYGRGETQEATAEKLGVSQSAISRELKRGADRGSYNPLIISGWWRIRKMQWVQQKTAANVSSSPGLPFV